MWNVDNSVSSCERLAFDLLSVLARAHDVSLRVYVADNWPVSRTPLQH
jgi:hypothetical protein